MEFIIHTKVGSSWIPYDVPYPSLKAAKAVGLNLANQTKKLVGADMAIRIIRRTITISVVYES